MKFNLGYWKMLPDTQAIIPVSIVDVRAEPDALVVTGFDRVVRTRDDLIGGTTITARFTSPAPDVIRVQVTHFKGRRERLPAFDLDYAQANASAVIAPSTRQSSRTA